MRARLIVGILAMLYGGLVVGNGCAARITYTLPEASFPETDGNCLCERNWYTDKTVCYPTDDIGKEHRKGAIPGKRIGNYKFGKGWLAAGDPAIALDTSVPLKEIMLSDFYDPESRKYRILHIGAGSVWCSPCRAESTEISSGIAQKLYPKGVIFIHTLVDGNQAGVAATEQHLLYWYENFVAPAGITQVLDPRPPQLGLYYLPDSVPWNADIDLRTMEILDYWGGKDDNLEARIQSSLDWTNANPPRSGAAPCQPTL